MKLLSVNLARPTTLRSRGRVYETGIFKAPVEGPVSVHRLGLTGDKQFNRKYHGGPRKAVYLYPHEHYAFWQEQFPGRELPPGSFGENLTTTGLLETAVHEGDQLRIGTAMFEVTEPRMPCSTLALKFERPDMVRRFTASRLSGFYLAVVGEGAIEAGLSIELLPAGARGASISETFSERSAARR